MLWRIILVLVLLSACSNVNDVPVVEKEVVSKSLPLDYNILEYEEEPEVVEHVEDPVEWFEGNNTYEPKQIIPKLEIVIFDVSGNGVLIKSPSNRTVLINTGDVGSGAKIGRRLLSRGIDTVNYVVVSDHEIENVGGYSSLVEHVKVLKTFYNGFFLNKIYYTDFLESTLRKGLTEVYENKVIQLDDDIKVELFVPYDRDSFVNGKIDSILVKVTYKEFTYLDASSCMLECEKVLLRQNIDLRADLLKIADFGSDDASSDLFLNKVNPSFALLTHQKLASVDTLIKLRRRGLTFYDPDDKHKDIVVISDGTNVPVIS